MRQFRMENNSISGNHAPGVPHVHFEVYPPGGNIPTVNNHVPFGTDCMAVPIGIKGRISNENIHEPYVIVQDDTANTSGYLVLQSSDQAFDAGHDTWVPQDSLEAFFQETGWQVSWSKSE